MGQALYRKYRSKTLSEVIGQEHITRTLEQALKTNRLSHAFLFTGPRGVGKTSIARIMAHEVNGLPYTDEQAHLDIIEIDAASNNGVEDVRDLREKAYVAPATASYKVYIIDEVHMLSKAAFNALLKILEEPPAHVIFILATTEAHKVPETIVSRTQRYIFRPIEHDKVVQHLRFIADQEKIDIDDQALQLIARHGSGSFRDSIGLLDQVSNQGGHVSLDSIQLLLGIPPEEAIDQLLGGLNTGTGAVKVIETLSSLYEQGFQAAAIAKRLSQRIRDQFIAGQSSGLTHDQLIHLMSELIKVPASYDPERFLEIVLLDFINPETTPGQKPTVAEVTTPQPPSISGKASKKPAAEPSPKSPKATSPESSATVQASPESKKEDVKQAKTAAKPKIDQKKGSSSALSESTWPQVLDTLKSSHNTLHGVIKSARPIFNDGQLELIFGFNFHRKRINDLKNKKIVADVIQQVTGQTVEIICSLDNSTATAPAADTSSSQPAPAKDPINTISNIFGGAELLES